METSLLQNSQNTLLAILDQSLLQVSAYLPRIVAALFVLLVGAALAKAISRAFASLLEIMKVSSAIKKTPVEHFLKNADLTQKIETVLGKVVYWLLMLVVLHSTVAILGLTPLSAVLEKILGYIPQVFSAILVLFFGVLLAGVVESLVKGAIRSIDGQSSLLLGKISSYLVISLSALAAISELGIASEFIMILFVGFVATVTLGFGLAIGLGGQHVVKTALQDWYDRVSKEVAEQ